jgi:hypothetical protein
MTDLQALLGGIAVMLIVFLFSEWVRHRIQKRRELEARVEWLELRLDVGRKQ